jgi:hypothetical protein
VLRICPDVGDPADGLEVQPLGDHLVEPLGRPPGRPLADDVGERVLVVHQPVMTLLEGQVDQPVVGVVAEDLGEQVAGDRRDRLLDQAWDQHLGDERLDIGVAKSVQRQRQDRGTLGHHPRRVDRVVQPLGRTCRHLGDHQAVTDDLLLQEVLLHEVLEAPAELVLAPGDQRRVRDRQAQRVLEQRRHREPVGDRAHHAGLGTGVDVAPEAVAVERDQVDERSEEEQPDRERAHPSEPTAPLGVGSALGEDHRQGHRPATLPEPGGPLDHGRMARCRPRGSWR